MFRLPSFRLTALRAVGLSPPVSGEEFLLCNPPGTGYRSAGGVMFGTTAIGRASAQRCARLKGCPACGTVTAPADQRNFPAIRLPMQHAANCNISLTLKHQDRVGKREHPETDRVHDPGFMRLHAMLLGEQKSSVRLRARANIPIRMGCNSRATHS